MSKLRLTGLILIVLAILISYAFPIVRGYRTFIAAELLLTLVRAGPIYIVLALSLLWPRRGGMTASVLSLCLAIVTLLMGLLLEILTGIYWQGVFGSSLAVKIDLVKWPFFRVAPYFVTFVGNLLAFIAVRRISVNSISKIQERAITYKHILYKVGLAQMFLAGTAQILFGVVVYGVAVFKTTINSEFWMFIFGGITLGSFYGGPTLLLAMLALRWPRKCGIIIITGFLALVALFVTIAFFPLNNISLFADLWFVVIPASVVALIGSIMSLIFSRNLSPAKPEP